MTTEEKQRLIATTRALELMAQAHPRAKSSILPDDPSELRKRIMSWSMFLGSVPPEMILPATVKAIEDCQAYVPSAGHITAAHRELGRLDPPEPTLATEWVREAARSVWSEPQAGEESHRRSVRAALAERINESCCSDEYVPALVDFTIEWAWRISNSTEGDSAFRAQMRDALAARLRVTTRWKSQRSIDPAAVNERALKILEHEERGALPE